MSDHEQVGPSTLMPGRLCDDHVGGVHPTSGKKMRTAGAKQRLWEADRLGSRPRGGCMRGLWLVCGLFRRCVWKGHWDQKTSTGAPGEG